MAHVDEFINEIKAGAKQNHGNMTLYCLLSADQAAMEFMQMDTASATVVERRSVSLGNDLRLESEKFKGAGLEF